MKRNAQKTTSGNDPGRAAGTSLNAGLDYRTIFNAASNGMAFTEFSSGRILDVNDAWLRATGMVRENAIGMVACELGLWADQAERKACYAELESKGRVVDFEARLLMKSAELPHMISAQFVEMGGMHCVLWEFRDIAEQQRTNEALTKSEGQVKSLLAASEQSRRALLSILQDEQLAKEALRAGNALLQIASRIGRLGGWSVQLADNRVLWSDEVASIHDMPVGYSPSLEEGMNFYAPEWRARISAVFGACAREGHAYDEELEIISAQGRRIWVRAIGEAVRDEAGTVTQVQGAFQDISDRKRAEEKIKSQLEELQRWQDVMLGREDRVQELKREVNKLCQRIGETARYPSQEEQQ